MHPRASNGRARSAVVLGQVSPLIGRGLAQILGEDVSIQLVDSEMNEAELKRAVACRYWFA